MTTPSQPGPTTNGRHGDTGVTRFDRLELKFVVDDAARARMLPALRERLGFDVHGDAEGVYRVATVYYDNADRDVYWERARGIKPRHKLRLRRYGPVVPENGPAFAEIKTRLRRRVVKRRIHLAPEAAAALCAGVAPQKTLEPTDALLADDIVRMVQGRQLEPAVLVRYKRQAFVGPDGLRVTFDSDLTYRLRDVTGLDDPAMDGQILGDDRCVLEVKVTQVVPHWLTLVVARSGATLRRFSKYCRALEIAGEIVPPVTADYRPAQVSPTLATGKLWTPSTGS